LESQGISISDHVLEEMYQESGKKTTEKLNYDDFVPFLIKFAAVSPQQLFTDPDFPFLAKQKERFRSASCAGN
jgi:hypothetical protein